MGYLETAVLRGTNTAPQLGAGDDPLPACQFNLNNLLAPPLLGVAFGNGEVFDEAGAIADADVVIEEGKRLAGFERFKPQTHAAKLSGHWVHINPIETAADHVAQRVLIEQRRWFTLAMSQRAHEKLRYAQELLGHQVPTGDIAQVFERALDALIPQLERQKFAATSRPHPRPRPTTALRHIPAQVKRAVWERDQGQCTFVSEAGRRCPARTRLEFDHIVEVARGGEATVSGIRLRCRAHNIEGSSRHGAVRMSLFRREPRSAMPGRTC